MGRRNLRRRRGGARLVREIGLPPLARGSCGADRHAAGAAQADSLAPVAGAGEALVRGPAVVRDVRRAHAGRAGGRALASGNDSYAALIHRSRPDQARETSVSLFDTLLMFGLLAAGMGLVARSVRAHPEEADWTPTRWSRMRRLIGGGTCPRRSLKDCAP